MTSYDRWLESPYTDVDDIECDDCEKCADECTTHEVAEVVDEEPDYDREDPPNRLDD
jgi:ferredoxin